MLIRQVEGRVQPCTTKLGKTLSQDCCAACLQGLLWPARLWQGSAVSCLIRRSYQPCICPALSPAQPASISVLLSPQVFNGGSDCNKPATCCLDSGCLNLSTVKSPCLVLPIEPRSSTLALAFTSLSSAAWIASMDSQYESAALVLPLKSKSATDAPT